MKRGRKIKISEGKMKKAIEGSGGVMLTVSQRCGLSYGTVWEYFNKPENAHMKQLLDEERDKIIDTAENKLHKKVREEDWNAIKFTLQTVGAKRGYQDKQQVEHFGAAGIEVRFAEPVENRKVVDQEDNGESE